MADLGSVCLEFALHKLSTKMITQRCTETPPRLVCILVQSLSIWAVRVVNYQGGLCSSHITQLAHHLLLCSQKHLRSLHAVHILGELNHAANKLSLPGEWRLHRQLCFPQ